MSWIQSNFYIPETNAPIKLEPYQLAVVQEALAVDSGLFRYSFILWSDIKKSAKSTIAGAMALYLAWHHAWESVRIVGNDLKQADSRTFFYIERAIRLNPDLYRQCKIKTYEITLPNHTVISAVPVDPKGEAGGGDLATVFTEMWAMKNKASQQMWSETTLSPLKFGKSLRIGESYAGVKGESPILEPLYEQYVKPENLYDIGFEGLELYRKQRTLCLWNTQRRCWWQLGENGQQYYAQEASNLVPSEFSRMHENKWQQGRGAFIPIEWWDACRIDIPSLENGAMVLGVDAAVDNDCFAIVGVTTRWEGIHRVPQVRYCNVWYPPKGGSIELSKDVDGKPSPESELRRLIAQYNIIEVAFDPSQMAYMHQMLRQLANWKKFEQGTPRLIADKRLFDLIRERHIEHSGDVILRQHLLNACQEVDPESHKLRIVKGADQTKKIDAAVALSMACDRALYYQF